MTVVAVVDDDVSILDAMTLLIEEQGWEALVFENGEAFLEHYRAHQASPDCVILDPHLNGTTGEAVARVLAGTDIPVIGLTARPESPVTAAIEALGVSPILTKPAQPDELVEAIRNAI